MPKKETPYDKAVRQVKHLSGEAYERWVHISDKPHDPLLDEIGTVCDTVLKYLEKQAFVPENAGQDDWTCGNCGEPVGWEELECCGIDAVKYNFCPMCGKTVKWK